MKNSGQNQSQHTVGQVRLSSVRRTEFVQLNGLEEVHKFRDLFQISHKNNTLQGPTTSLGSF